MENEIVIEQGVAIEFKTNLQKTYDFLNDCNDSLLGCEILEELGFDNGNRTSYTEAINNTKSEITSLLSQVTNCEEDLLALDENASDRLNSLFDEVDDSDQETIVINSASDNQVDNNDNQIENEEVDGSSQTNQDSSTTQSSSDDTQTDNDTSSNNQGTGQNNDNFSNNNYNDDSNWYGGGQEEGNDNVDNPYQFSLDYDEAYSRGDIFINEEKSLTMFTNYLLNKYGITNPNVAKKVYQAVIKYGNEYYKGTGKNLLLELSEKVIMDKIYEEVSYLVSDSNKDTFWDLLKNVSL